MRGRGSGGEDNARAQRNASCEHVGGEAAAAADRQRLLTAHHADPGARARRAEASLTPNS